MSEPDPVEGWQGTLVSTPDGAQFDDCFVLTGDYSVRYGISSAVAQSGELELQERHVGRLARHRHVLSRVGPALVWRP